MIEFKRKVFEFKLDEQTHRVKSPTVRQIQEFQKMANKGEEIESIGNTIKFLSDLGLSEEVAYGMQADHLEGVVQAIIGKK